MFDEFFPQTKITVTHSVVSRVNEEAHERHSDIPLISRVVRGRVGERCAFERRDHPPNASENRYDLTPGANRIGR